MDITKRLAVVEKRNRLGDGEGDTVHGQSAHWVTLVDRKSRFTLVKRVLSKSKQAVGDAWPHYDAQYQSLDGSRGELPNPPAVFHDSD